MSATADLPVVDLRTDVRNDALRRGLLETGFFHLRDHEVPSDLLGAVREEAARFFALPADGKHKYAGFLQGYAALRSEDVESGFGTGEYGGGDLCEKFTMCPEPSASERVAAGGYYDAPEAHPFFGENPFPTDEFGRVWRSYFDHMQRLSRRLMAAVRTTLGESTERWKDSLDHPCDSLRFLSYPEIESSGPRMAAHYDDNVLTLLHQSLPENGFGSLQVMPPGEDRWRVVEPDDRYFVVNVGDALMYLTEGRAVATKHRVVNPPPENLAGSARTSLVFFHIPNWNCPLRPVFPDVIDHSLGQARSDFGFDALRDPDGTIPYYRILQRESDLGFTK